MNKQPSERPEHESPDDILQRAVESLVSDTVPGGPSPALDAATLRTLVELDRPPRRSFPFVPRTRIMKFAAIAASLMVVISLLRLWTPTVDSSAAFGSIFSEALKRIREAHSMSYVEEMIIEGKKDPIIVKEFFAEDGRKRSETEIGPRTTTRIFDTAGHLRLALVDLPNLLAGGPDMPTGPRKTLTDELQVLMDRQKQLANRLQMINGQSEKDIELRQTLSDELLKLAERQKELADQLHLLADQSFTPPHGTRMAIIGEPKEDQGINPGDAFRNWLQHLKGLGDRPERVLEKKELDGKQVIGFVTRQNKHTFTMWINNATGQPVLIEFDSKVNGAAARVTMMDFHFQLALDESLFSFDVPPGYKIIGPPGNGKIEPPTGLELAWSIKGGWSGVARTPESPAIYALDFGGRLAELESRWGSGCDNQNRRSSGVDPNGEFCCRPKVWIVEVRSRRRSRRLQCRRRASLVLPRPEGC